jgi:hypothetical protein
MGYIEDANLFICTRAEQDCQTLLKLIDQFMHGALVILAGNDGEQLHQLLHRSHVVQWIVQAFPEKKVSHLMTGIGKQPDNRSAQHYPGLNEGGADFGNAGGNLQN